MNHDAGEGHRLLHEAYARNGTLGPIQTLSSFSRSHREAWSRLRGRLPVQLHDVGNQVNSVFDAIDQEVSPLQAQLPHIPGTTARTPDTRAPQGRAPPGPTVPATPRPHPTTAASTTPGRSPRAPRAARPTRA